MNKLIAVLLLCAVSGFGQQNESWYLGETKHIPISRYLVGEWLNRYSADETNYTEMTEYFHFAKDDRHVVTCDVFHVSPLIVDPEGWAPWEDDGVLQNCHFDEQGTLDEVMDVARAIQKYQADKITELYEQVRSLQARLACEGRE
jgi:hypothetical protein